jgi:hypothetical protein
MAKNVCTTVYCVYILYEVCKSVPVHLPATSHPFSNAQTLKHSNRRTEGPHRPGPHAANWTIDPRCPERHQALPTLIASSILDMISAVSPCKRRPLASDHLHGETTGKKQRQKCSLDGQPEDHLTCIIFIFIFIFIPMTITITIIVPLVSAAAIHAMLLLPSCPSCKARPASLLRNQPPPLPSFSPFPVLLTTPPDKINDAPPLFCSPDRDSFPCIVASLLPHSLLVLYGCLLYGIWIGILTLCGACP